MSGSVLPALPSRRVGLLSRLAGGGASGRARFLGSGPLAAACKKVARPPLLLPASLTGGKCSSACLAECPFLEWSEGPGVAPFRRSAQPPFGASKTRSNSSGPLPQRITTRLGASRGGLSQRSGDCPVVGAGPPGRGRGRPRRLGCAGAPSLQPGSPSQLRGRNCAAGFPVITMLRRRGWPFGPGR